MKKTAFMIMPFSNNDANQIYNHIVKKTCESLEIDIKRVDELHTSTSITEDIYTSIENSDIIIVDLSKSSIENNSDILSFNPNVFYEYGYAKALKKNNIISICNQNDLKNLPFDIKVVRTIPYINTLDGGHKLEKTLKLSIEETLEIINTQKKDDSENSSTVSQHKIERQPDIKVCFNNDGKSDTLTIKRSELKNFVFSEALFMNNKVLTFNNPTYNLKINENTKYITLNFMIGNFGQTVANNLKITFSLSENYYFSGNFYFSKSTNYGHTIYDKGYSTSVSFSKAKISHDKNFINIPIFYIISKNNEFKNFDIDYEIFAEEYPDLVKGQLHVIIEDN